MSDKHTISSITVLVEDYDEAIDFYTDKLGFQLVDDVDIGNGQRWVQVAAGESKVPCLSFVKATTAQQQKNVGLQAGGSVFLILQTEHFWTDYENMITRGVVFDEMPRVESYGTVVVFRDLYGNKLDLIERTAT